MARPAAGRAAVILAAGLTLGSLKAGLQADDYYHRGALLGPERTRVLDPDFFPGDSIFDMFRFLDGNPARTQRFMDIGMPWWTNPDIRAAFMRPLTAATHKLDYWLWPHSTEMMHAHSIAWFALLVVVVARVYRRFLGERCNDSMGSAHHRGGMAAALGGQHSGLAGASSSPTAGEGAGRYAAAAAGIATILYAIDDARAIPVGWLANRNALPAGVFGMLAILAHDRWRREGRSASAAWAMLWTTASLLSAEAGVGTLALIGAHAVCLDREPILRRALIILPYLAILALWRASWLWLGFGVEGMGGYVDPIGDPLLYLRELARRVPLLLMGQWSPLIADVAVIVDPEQVPIFVGIGLVVIALIAMLLMPLLRRDATARFFALSMVLALPPVAATSASNRLLLFSGVGAMGLLGMLFADWMRRFRAATPDRRGWSYTIVVIAPLLLTHAVIAPCALAMMAANPIGGPDLQKQLLFELPDDPALESQTIVVVNGPSPFHVTSVGLKRAAEGRSVPKRIRVLGPAREPLTVKRPDERTLVLKAERGYLRHVLDYLYRGERNPMALHEKVVLTGMKIEVLELTADGRPRVVSFQFDRPLEDPALVWLGWKDGRYGPFALPEVGRTLDLPASELILW